jgi:clan AA aspartic protease
VITGSITPDREAIVRLTLLGPGAQREEIDAIIDTGYTGDLTLPSTLVRALSLPRRGVRDALLADGSRVRLRVYEVSVIWDGQPRTALALEADGGPLVGMSLLYGHVVTLQVLDGGFVTIAPLP